MSSALRTASIAWLILYGSPDTFPPYVLGLVNFLNFTFSALLGPVFARGLLAAGGSGDLPLTHDQTAFQPLLYGVVIAIVLTILLKETGPAARQPVPARMGYVT